MSEFADVTDVSKKAVQFYQMYYKALDTSMQTREEMLNLYFRAVPDNGGCLMQWNGHMLNTVEDIAQYLQSLPKTKHDVRCVDAQPLPGNQQGDSFMITINGKCTYDDEHVRFFYQRLVVMKAADSKFYIVNDYLRWTGEEI